MPADDILWKKVDELKSEATAAKLPTSPVPRQRPELTSHLSWPAAKQASDQSSHTSSMPASKRASMQVSALASTSAPFPQDWIEATRKAVKTTGKEVAFARLTPVEKRQLADIVYSYKRQGIKTSENEVLRIAINLLLEDFKTSGKQSVLARVIEALLA